MRSVRSRRLAVLASVAVFAAVTTATPLASAAVVDSPGAQACEDGSSGARVPKGSTAQEPALYPPKDAKKYGVIKDSPRMPDGSVSIDTVFHVVTATAPTPAEKAKLESMITAQMTVLNDSYSGATAPDAADSPFRFALTQTTWTVNAAWSTVATPKIEREMKAALYQGDSETLNVYVTDIIDIGLLGWAYFPKDYNNGRDFIDGVVLETGSMPGGTYEGQPWKYGEGDTLTHEVGHWMMLEHTFAGGCSASGDGVADTPREAIPQFDCPIGADTCSAPGLDPIHNFMDYTQDSCMNMFTPGQVERMNDAWIQFRAGGLG
jgi:hypothetical protein